MTNQARPCHVLVDTDGGLDDALALTYLARHPGIDLVAVSSVHGNVAADTAADNALRLFELAANPDIPVHVGAATPLHQPLHLRHPDNPVGTLTGRPHRSPDTAEPAADLIVRLARQRPGTLTLLAIGPLTNVALAVRREPGLPHLIHRIVIMGGALNAPGNITRHAESNIWHDPEAADEVLAAGFTTTLIPLDITRTVTVTQEWLRTLAADRSHFWGSVAALLHRRQPLPPLPLHDPVAAVLTLQPELAAYEDCPLGVELHDQATRGRTRPTQDGRPPISVATTVDPATIRNALLATLTMP